MRWRLDLLAVLALAACAAPPRPGGEVRVEVLRMMTLQELDADADRLDSTELRRREVTGVRPFVGAGRVAVTRCALADNELLFSLAVLPDGTGVVPGNLMVVHLGDRDRGELDRAVGPVTQPAWLVRGSMARAWQSSRTLLPWSSLPAEDTVEPAIEQQYHRVKSGMLLRCRAP